MNKKIAAVISAISLIALSLALYLGTTKLGQHSGSTVSKHQINSSHESDDKGQMISLPSPSTATTQPDPIKYTRNDSIYDRATPLKNHIEMLRKSEKLDASIAYDVGSQIAVCAITPTGLDVIDNLTHGSDSEVAVASALLETNSYCNNISREDLAFGMELLEMAANNGLEEAQINLFHFGKLILDDPAYRLDNDAIAHFKQIALSSLQSAAARGSARAYFNLSQAYEYGDITQESPQMALSMYYKYLQISGDSSPSSIAHLEYLEKINSE